MESVILNYAVMTYCLQKFFMKLPNIKRQENNKAYKWRQKNKIGKNR